MELDEHLNESQEGTHLSDKDIFIKIWTSPRLVFKYINDFNYDKYDTVLLVLAGISTTFDRASTKNMGDDMSLTGVLAICIIAGGLLGWIGIYFYMAMIGWTGQMLNAQGNIKSLVRMAAHAMIPSIVALVLLIPQIALFGNGIFQSDMDVYGSGLLATVIFFVTLLLELTLGIWTLVLLVVGISEVQKLSIGKSILNLILPALLIVSLIFLTIELFR